VPLPFCILPRTEFQAMLDIYGPRLDTYIAVSATQYRPEFSVVPFSLEARDLIVEIGVPRWDTHRGVNGEQSYEIGKIGELSVGGSYRYYAEPKPDHQESLTLHVEVRARSTYRLTDIRDDESHSKPWVGSCGASFASKTITLAASPSLRQCKNSKARLTTIQRLWEIP
jgi:hypothetical protein